MREVTISIFLFLMKGTISRLTSFSPITSEVSTGVTFIWIPSLDWRVVWSISLKVVVTLRWRFLTPALPIPPRMLIFGGTWNLPPRRVPKRRMKVLALILPKFCVLVLVNEFTTCWPAQSVCHEPHCCSPRPVWVLIPNSRTAKSYSSVFMTTLASTNFVSVQVSESGLNLILPE